MYRDQLHHMTPLTRRARPFFFYGLFVVCLCCVFHASADAAFAIPLTSYLFSDLEESAGNWHLFQDQGFVTGNLTNTSIPGANAPALKITLADGQSYAGLHAYRNLEFVDATTFDLSMSFFFPNEEPIQALEFTANKWQNNQRWEWALQWERIGDGSSEQGTPPGWRLWTGNNWQSVGVTQSLAPDVWHHLHLSGDIVDGKVHYISFNCDTLTHYLDRTFLPVYSIAPDLLAVGVQLDGNYQEDSYQIYVDNVALALD